MTQKINIPASPTEAEVQAARAAVYLARDLHLDSVEFEGDASTIISALNSSGPNFTTFGHIIEDILTEASLLPWFSFSHVHRSANRVADFLAKKAFSISNKHLWLPPMPQDISHVIVSDSDL